MGMVKKAAEAGSRELRLIDDMRAYAVVEVLEGK
jgi:hypothetical protein